MSDHESTPQCDCGLDHELADELGLAIRHARVHRGIDQSTLLQTVSTALFATAGGYEENRMTILLSLVDNDLHIQISTTDDLTH